MARTKRSRRSYSAPSIKHCHYWGYRPHTACAYLIPYPLRNGNPIDSTGALWTRRGFRPVAGPGRPWTESDPRWRGGLARPGDRGDRRAECRSARESWPAGLPDALKGEGIGSAADAATVQEERLDAFEGPLPACRVRRVRRFQPRPPRGAGNRRGIEGGRQPPSPARRVIRGVYWLDQLTVGQASAAEPVENALLATARNPAYRAVTDKLPGLVVGSLKDGEGDRPGSITPRDCATLWRAPGFRPTRTPRRPEIVDLGRSCGP